MDKRGRTGKKCGVTSSKGWHPSEISKSDSDEQKSSVFQDKINRGDIGELADGCLLYTSDAADE